MATRPVHHRDRLARRGSAGAALAEPVAPGGVAASDAAGERSIDQPPLPQLGDWRLVDEVGRGAWTRVYLARPVDGQRSRPGCYAVKLLDAEHDADPLAVAAMRREALVGMSVTHPHLVSVLAAHVHEPPHYLVEPFLPGATLAERLAGERLAGEWDVGQRSRGGPLAIRTALWIARQIASALAALHEALWLHRDVKPANVIVSPSGHATLIDLGLCQPLDYAAACAHRPVVGTFDYLAPEAATPGMACGPATDLYSLGVMLFEMLAGRPPFSGDTPEELAAQHRRIKPPPIGHLRPDASPELAQLLRELLAKQPLRRPATAQEVVDRLVRLEITTLACG